MRSSMQQLASYSVVFFLSFSSYPSEVRCSLGVRGLLDQLIDPLKVVGHRLTGVDVRHLQSVRLVCLSVCLSIKNGATGNERKTAYNVLYISGLREGV